MMSVQHKTLASRIPALALFALFVCALLLALVAGVRVYDAQVADSNKAADERFANGLISNSVKSLDSYDAITAQKGPNGKALVLLEATDGGVFETRIYQYDHAILMEYTPAGETFAPSKATKLIDSDMFDFTLTPTLLSVITDEGQTDIALRSFGMGA